jgi:hypothetical protein
VARARAHRTTGHDRGRQSPGSHGDRPGEIAWLRTGLASAHASHDSADRNLIDRGRRAAGWGCLDWSRCCRTAGERAIQRMCCSIVSMSHDVRRPVRRKRGRGVVRAPVRRRENHRRRGRERLDGLMGRTAARGEWGVHPPHTIDRAAGCSACGAVGRRAAGRGVRLPAASQRRLEACHRAGIAVAVGRADVGAPPALGPAILRPHNRVGPSLERHAVGVELRRVDRERQRHHVGDTVELRGRQTDVIQQMTA